MKLNRAFLCCYVVYARNINTLWIEILWGYLWLEFLDNLSLLI